MNATHAHVAVVASRTPSSFRKSWLDFFSSGRVAFPAVERSTERGRPPLYGRDPQPIHPRWVVTHVLLMAAVELCNPVALVVLVKSRDVSVHEGILIDDASGSTGAHTRQCTQPAQICYFSALPRCALAFGAWPLALSSRVSASPKASNKRRLSGFANKVSLEIEPSSSVST